MKRVLSFILSAIIVIGVFFSAPFTLNVFAADIDDLKFELNEDGFSYSVIRCSQYAEGELIIPAEYEGLPVTKIKTDAFTDCEKITSITISENIISLNPLDFRECIVLTEIIVSDGNVNYSSLNGVLFNNDKTTLYCYPKAKTGSSYNMPDTVEVIYAYSFEKCKNLASIELADNLKEIREYAFYSCANLQSLYIPEKVELIGELAFDTTTNLAEITVASGNINFKSEDGVLFNYNKTKLIKYPSKKDSVSYAIPDGVIEICDYAFKSNKSLKDIDLPHSLIKIGCNAFYGCSSLTEVIIPNSVEHIGETAFYDCNSLSTIKLPNKLTCISTQLFLSCDSLSSVEIPNSVTRIETSAFYSCKSLKSINIPDSVTHIGNMVFHKCTSLESIIIPDSVIELGGHVFDECKNLEYVNLSSNIDEIKSGLFKYCSKLQNIVIPSGVKQIDDYAFYGSHINTIYIPDSVERIGEFTFRNCNSLENVYYGGSYSQYKDIDINFFNEGLLNAKKYYNSEPYSAIIESIKTYETLFAFYSKETSFENSWGGSINFLLENINVKFNDVSIKKDKGMSATLNDITTSITFSREDYQDYIVPYCVVTSWKNNFVKNQNIFISKDKKDGRPYISTVFARISANSEQMYEEVTTNTINILENKNYDVIISLGNLENETPKEYWISQGGTHKVSNTTGVFSSVYLFDIFESGKPVYAYVVFESGLQTEPVQIKLERKEYSSDVLNTSEVNILGDDLLGFVVSDDIPVLGGLNMNFNFIEVPIGVQIEGDRIRISVGVDIFSYDSEKSNEEKWTWFKDSVETIDEVLDKKTEKAEAFGTLLESIGLDKKGSIKKADKISAEGDFLGYAEGYITTDGFVWTAVSGSVVLELFMNIENQFLIGGLPVYTYFNAGGEASGKYSGSIIIPDKNLNMITNLQMKLEPQAKIGGGVGVDDFLALGIYGKAKIPLVLDIQESYNHFTWDLIGELGLEVDLLFVTIEQEVFKGEFHIVDKYYDKTKNSTNTLSYSISEFIYPRYSNSTQPTSNAKLLSRDYIEASSDWLGDMYYPKQYLSSSFSTTQDFMVKDLQTTVYKNSQLQLVKFNDTMMMAWIEDCEDRDDYNRFRLVYSVYNPTTDTWSEPIAVDDNGKNDSSPSLATDGESVYIAWQNSNQVFTTINDTTTKEILQSTEIKVAEYNSETGLFDSVKTLTDNATYDYAPTVVVNNGDAEICWVNSSTTDFESGTLSILKNDFSDTNTVIAENLNYITSLKTNGSEISYSMDVDGDLTTDDVYLFTNNEQKTGLEEHSLTTPELVYGLMDDENILFFVDNCNIHYLKHGEVYDVFENSRAVDGNINIVNNNGKTTLVWTETTDIGTELFSCTYENNNWSKPVQLSEFNSIVSNVDLVSFKDALYGVFNRTNLTEVTDDEGEVTCTADTTDICLFKCDGFTDLEVTNVLVDETTFANGLETIVSVTVVNKGTEKIESIDFNISDGLGTSVDITKNISIETGATEIIELPYTVPEDFTKTELTISATVELDSNAANNSNSIDVGLPDITISDMNIEKTNSTYMITGLVTNRNCIDAENVVVKIVSSDSSEELSTIIIGSIIGNKTKEISFYLDENVLDTETESKTIKFIAETTSEEMLTTNNEGSVAILHDEVDGHEHIYEEWTIIKKASCTETGIQSAVCTVCGIPNTEIMDFVHNHESEWIMDDEKHWKICADGCGTIIDKEIHKFETVECICGKLLIPEDSSELLTIEDESTIIEKDKKLIITDKLVLDDMYEIVTLDIFYEFIITPSYDFNSFTKLGTGSKVEIYYDDCLIDSYTLVVRGDVNGDSVCDVLDCMLIELARNNHITLEGAIFTAGDLTENGEITVEDFQNIASKAIA